MTTQLPPDPPETLARHHARLAARLAAEPLALAAWSQDTNHPRLAAAHQALIERATPRVEDVTKAVLTAGTATEDLPRLVAQSAEDARWLRFEPSRLKWLLAGRAERLAAHALPGHAAHRDDEVAERTQLQAILDELLATMC